MIRSVLGSFCTATLEWTLLVGAALLIPAVYRQCCLQKGVSHHWHTTCQNRALLPLYQEHYLLYRKVCVLHLHLRPLLDLSYEGTRDGFKLESGLHSKLCLLSGEPGHPWAQETADSKYTRSIWWFEMQHYNPRWRHRKTGDPIPWGCREHFQMGHSKAREQ